MRKSFLVLALGAAVGTVTGVVAQTIDGLDIGAIAKRIEERDPAADAFVAQVAARAKEQQTNATEVAGVANASLKNLDPAKLPRLASTNGVDLDELVSASKASQTEPRSAPMFIAFASFAMPQDTLRSMIADVTRAGGVVVFRGLPGNSGKTFAIAMKTVATQDQAANMAIDPRLFRAFKVDRVPTYVVASSDFSPCDGFDCTTDIPPHDRMTGNVRASYALQAFADGGGAGAAVSRVALANLARKE